MEEKRMQEEQDCTVACHFLRNLMKNMATMSGC